MDCRDVGINTDRDYERENPDVLHFLVGIGLLFSRGFNVLIKASDFPGTQETT